ncbi:TonB-dependent receptor [soil metagenome]
MSRILRFCGNIVLLCLLLFSCNQVFSQGKLKGLYIVNETSKVPVQDAFVQSSDLIFNASADENGFVSFKNLPASATRLSISCIGFETKTIELPTPNVSENTAIVYLTTKVSSLEEVRIRASANNGVFKTISDLDIHLRPISNSQEVLRMVPGLFIGQHAGGGKAEQIFLRGFDLDHGTDINITVDGLPVNMVSHAHGQGYADLHFVIPELIDKVNFNKGPYFADKGNFTTAGFVEFKTKDYLESNFLKVEGGQFNTFRGITGINLLKPKGVRRTQSLYVAGEASYTKGYFESPQDFNRYNGTLKYHGTISDNSSLTTTITAFTSKWNASGQIPDRAVASGMVGFYGAIDNTEGGKTSRYNANVELLSNLNNGGVFRNQIFYSRYKFELYSNFTFYKEDPVNGDQIRQKEDRNIYGYNGSYRKEFSLGNIKTETRTGVQVRYDDVNDIELTRTKNRTANTAQIMQGDVNELNIGAYWSQRFSLSKNLDITGALRADYFTNRYNDMLASQILSSNSTIVTPKLNFNFRVNDNVQLYLYNGRGFHSNDTRVAVQQAGKKVLPPAYGSDLGGIFRLGNKVVLQSALWYLWLDQEFVYVGDEGVVEAGGKTRRFGFDFSARYEVIKNLFADADISFADPRATSVDKAESYLPLAPRLSSIGGLTYRKEYGFNGSLRYRYMADRPANEDNSVIAKGYFVTDAAINYTQKKWEAGLAIQNLFDVKWKETQFDTESRLQNEPDPVSEIHFTPGTPFFARVSIILFF